MHTRQASLLKYLVRLYIANADPVSSSALVGMDTELDLSSATIRNEMSALEEEGYVRQPYTSAGRVPTEKGYRFYVENCLETRAILQETFNRLQEAVVAAHIDEGAVLRRVAKVLAELAHEAVIVSHNEDCLYYTGLSYLLSQPEFKAQEHAAEVSHLLDECEQITNRLTYKSDANTDNNETHFLIGSENPFGEGCALVITPIPKGFMGVLGPMRMDYDYAVSLINQATQLLGLSPNVLLK